ncbi:MAG TPA: TMEM165/GDT1 family protein [Nitriliruptorales bacterium]|nr:TMEM165/GDT1 family protein [Nitriliruptorales bacterium]
MDLRTFATVFSAVFLAELGDKTQLAVLSFATGAGGRLAVFVGASLALVASTALAVVVGEALPRVVPVAWLRLGAAGVFVGVGILVAVEALGELRA